jgi:hypothetical protein
MFRSSLHVPQHCRYRQRNVDVTVNAVYARHFFSSARARQTMTRTGIFASRGYPAYLRGVFAFQQTALIPTSLGIVMLDPIPAMLKCLALIGPPSDPHLTSSFPTGTAAASSFFREHSALLLRKPTDNILEKCLPRKTPPLAPTLPSSSDF